jgi:toxin YoeB
LSGWWSRRIDEENRIVYKEENGAVIIASCKGHYED